MFTTLTYLYRDASNYKQHGQIQLDGILSPEELQMIRSRLSEGDRFIPGDLPAEFGIEELQSKLPSYPSEEDDHVWHELQLDDQQRADTANPDLPVISKDAFVAFFRTLEGGGNWRIAEAALRLGL